MKKRNIKLFITKIRKTLISLKKAKVFLFVLSLLIPNNFTVFAVTVSTPAELITEIGVQNVAGTPQTITFLNDITLTAADSILPPITNSYQIDGGGFFLDCDDTVNKHRGFMFLGSSVTPPSSTPNVKDLEIKNAQALGGAGGITATIEGGSGGGGLGAGGAIYVGDGAETILSNITYTSNDATGGNSPAPAGALTASGGSGGGGIGGDGGNDAATVPENGGGGGGLLEGQNATGQSGSGAGADGATTAPASATTPGYGGGGGGAAEVAGTATGSAGVIGGGGGGGSGHATDNIAGATGGFGGGGGGGGLNGTGSTSLFGGGTGGNGDTSTTGGQGGGGAGLGGALFIDATSTATIIENTAYDFSGSSTTGGTGANSGSAAGTDMFLASGGNLKISTSGTFTLTQAIEADSINSTGGIEVLGGGIVNLSGAGAIHLNNTFRGDLTITAGTVQIDAAVSVGNGTGIIFPAAGAASTKIFEDLWAISVNLSNPITMTGPGTLKRDGFGVHSHNLRLTSAIEGSGRITIIGVGSIRPQVASPSFSGGWDIDGEGVANSGNLVFLSPDVLGSGSIQIQNGNYNAASQLGGALLYKTNSNASLSNNIELPSGDGTIVFGVGNKALTLSGIISGVGNLIFDQLGTTGSCILTGSNTYLGTTTILDGTVHSNVATALSNSSSITITSPGELRINNVSQTINSLGAANTGDIILNQGSSNTLTVTQTSSGAVSGDISGAGKFEKAGSGTLTFSTITKTYTGGTTISAGTLALDSLANVISFSGSVTIGTTASTATLDILTTSGSQIIQELNGNANGVIDINNKTLTIINDTGGTFLGIIQNTAGAGNIAKQGADTLTLGGTNTYTGTTTINAGTLELSGASGKIEASSAVTMPLASTGTFQIASGAGDKTINNFSGSGVTGSFLVLNNTGNKLTLTQTSDLIYSGAISGAGNLEKAGGSKLTLDPTSAFTLFTGSTTISAGTLALDNAIADMIKESSSVTIGTTVSTATLDILTTSADQQINELNGNANGIIDINTNTLTINNATGVGGDFGGVIQNTTGSGNITKIGGEALSLAGVSTYTGATLITDGILALDSSGSITNSSSVTVTIDGTLQNVSGNRTITDFSGAGDLILSAGTLTLNEAAVSPLTFSGNLSGAGSFEKAGAQTLLLTKATAYSPTFTGGAIIAAGTLELNSAADLLVDSSSMTINAGSLVITASTGDKTINNLDGSGGTIIDINNTTLTINQTLPSAFSGVITNTTGDGNIIKSGASTLTLDSFAVQTYTGSTTITAGTLELDSAVASFIIASSEIIINGGSLNITGNKIIQKLSGSSGGEVTLNDKVLSTAQISDGTFLGVFTGTTASGITKNGSNNLTLGGNSTSYFGTTDITAGTITLNDTGNIPDSDVRIASPGNLAIVTTTPFTKSIQSLLTGDGDIQLNNNSLTINQGSVETYSGIISGTDGGITKAGSFNLNFGAALKHSYTGPTTVSAGTLILLSAGSSIEDSSELALNTGNLTISGSVGDKSINTLSGSLGTVISLNSNKLTITQNSDKTYSGVISGSGADAIEKAGSRILTLSGTNTYTGTTTISAGSLKLSTASGSISLSSSVTISPTGASLDIEAAAGTKIIQNLSGDSGTNINLNNNDLTIDQSSIGTYSGVITGVSGGITKDTSAANLTLAGANTYAGPTTITGTGGKLIIDDTGSISDSSTLTILSPGIFAIETATSTPKSIKTLSTSDGNIELNTNPLTITQGTDATYSGVISSSSSTGGITKAGTSKLTLAGANTYTGPTTITAGTLTLVPAGAIDFSSTVTITSPGILEAENGGSVKNVNNLQGTGDIEFPINSNLIIPLTTSTTYSGDILGTAAFGVIILEGATNTLTLSGTNSFNELIIASGTVNISSDSNLPDTLIQLEQGTFRATETFTTSTSFNITTGSAKEIEVLTDKTLTLDGTITANNTVSKTGEGTLSIDSSNAGNTGVTTVAAGTMLMKPASRWSATTFNVSSGSNLIGTGTLEAAVTNAGTISPGESIGTLIIDGSYTENGTLEIEITSTPNDSDKVVVTGAPGTVQLNPSSTLSVFPLSSSEFFQEGTEYVIITAVNGVSGTFGAVVDTDPLLSFDVRYDPNQVVLIMSDSAFILPINEITNPNAKAVAEYLGSCNFSNPDFVSILISLSTLDLEDLTDALLQISPARFGALQLTNYTNNQTVSRILTDRLRKLYRCNKGCKEDRDEPCIIPKSFEFWVEPFSYFTHQRNLEDQRPFKNKVFGTVMGTDFNFSNHINFGGAGGYSYADIDWRGNLGYAKMHSAYGSLYASNYNHFGFINASVIGTGNFYDTKRKIRFADVDRKAKAKHKGFDVSTHLGGGLDFLMADDFYFQPTLDVDYTYVWHDGFKERGADSLNLIVDTSNFSRVKGVALLNFIKDIKLTNLCISPALKAGYAYEDELSTAKITSRLEGVSCTQNKFTIQTFHKNHSKGIVGANITGTQTDGFTFYVNYQFEFGHKFHQHLGSARFEWNF